MPFEMNPWHCILAALKENVDPITFECWLKPTRFDHNGDHRLFIHVSDEEVANYIERHFKELIEKELMGRRQLAGPGVRELCFTINNGPDKRTTLYEEVGLAKRSEGCPLVPLDAWQGISRRYLEIVSPCSEASDNYHIACFLTVAACGLGRSVYLTTAGSLFTNMYVTLVGSSAWARKSSAINFAYWLALESCPYFLDLPSLDSSEGVISAIQQELSLNAEKKRGSVLIVLDEFNRMLNKASMKGSTIFSLLKEAYGTPKSMRITRSTNPIYIQNPPTFNMIACSETDDLEDMGDRNTAGGFGNRILFVPGVRKKPIWDPPDPREDPRWPVLMSELRAIFKFWHDRNSTKLKFSPKANQLGAAFHAAAQKRGEDEEKINRLAARHDVYVKKVASIFAALEMQDVIQEDHMKAALSFVDFCLDSLYFAFKKVALKPWVEESMQILEFVKKEDGKVPIRELQRRFWRLGAETFERRMRFLVADEKNPDRDMVITTQENPKTGRPIRMVYLNR